MLCLCAVYSAVAVTCVQRHEHWSTMYAKLVADCKIHICDVRWARGQFVLQVGRRKTGRLRVVFNCLLVAGWKFPFHPPKGLQGCGVPFGFFVVCLFVYLFIYFWRGGGLLRLMVSSISIVFGWGVDRGQSGWQWHVKGGSRLPLPLPLFCPLHL